jgi:hypothetical protein
MSEIQRTESELAQLDAIELRHRELAAHNPFAAASFYLQNASLIDEARHHYLNGRPQLPRMGRVDDIPTPSRLHTLRAALLAPITQPKGST